VVRVLLGRTTELDRIRDVLARARGGRGGALVLRGDAGIGKTALLRAARAEARGMLVLDGAGIESESELPFAGLSLLLAPLRRELDPSASPQLDALAAAIGHRPGRPATRFAVYAGLLALLTDEAERRPVALLVDDAQWMDAATAEALGFCGRRLAEERIALLAAVRAGEPDPLARTGLPVLDVPPLSADDANALLREAMREGQPAPAPAVARVQHVAHGNPLALLELADRLRRGDDVWSEPPSVGAELEAALARRVGSLPDATRAALLLAAADDAEAADEVTGALRRRGDDPTALAPAEVAAVVRIGEGRLAFSHPLLRSAIYHLASAPDRRAAHADLAAELEARSQEARAAWHRALATVGSDDAVADRMEAVAREARSRDAPVAAARAFEAAARITGDDGVRAGRLLQAADCLLFAGRADAAVARLDEALPIADEPLLRADVLRMRALAAATRDPPSVTRDVLLEGSAAVEPLDPRRAARMLLEASALTVSVAEAMPARDMAERALEIAQRADADTRLLATGYLATYRIVVGDSREGEAMLDEAEALSATSEMASFTYASALVGHACMYTDQEERARRILDACIARARAESALVALPLALAWLAETDFRIGDWARAEAEAAESIAIGDEVGRPFETINGLVTLAAIRGARGRTDEALGHLDRAEVTVRATGFRSLAPHAGWARGLVHLSAGRPDEAVAALAPAGRAMEKAGVEEPNVVPWASDLAEAYARSGRPAEARTTLATLERQAARTGRVSALAAAARCRGLLAAEDAFGAHFAEALALHAERSHPFAEARTLLCFGERLRRARRRGEARELLRRALDAFERLDARPWAARVQAELEATGERTRARTPEHRDDLTPQELQVALLVAGGASNRDAAARLFITPRTVEGHLTRVYRKLGVRSRVEMVHRLGAVRAQAAGPGDAA
jgi:DNA-binding CsgD family transcriptional regulator